MRRTWQRRRRRRRRHRLMRAHNYASFYRPPPLPAAPSLCPSLTRKEIGASHMCVFVCASVRACVYAGTWILRRATMLALMRSMGFLCFIPVAFVLLFLPRPHTPTPPPCFRKWQKHV